MTEISTAIPGWPHLGEVHMGLGPLLWPRLKALTAGISEFTFAGIYLFRNTHHYRISDIGHGLLLISGLEDGEDFFMLPLGLPGFELLDEFLGAFSFLKNASQAQAATLGSAGYRVEADGDNFDYLYEREGLAALDGRKYHKKRNRVRGFLARYAPVVKPLGADTADDALRVLEKWREASETEGDYGPAREAISRMKELGLSGSVYYVEDIPVAFAIGEPLGRDQFAVHFEKGVPGYPGLLQYVNQSFAASLPESVNFINREQDLGIEGLRHAKLSYRPHSFTKKFRIYSRGRAKDEDPEKAS
ncbi:MAG: DUF2156 domain-containing protein [Thermodesulfobacteriota bacterium]